jgi:hypothetical protein
MTNAPQGTWLLPPAPDLCQTCACKHAPELPHNPQSFYYLCAFFAEHGRKPTWEDAWQHCTPEMQTLLTAELRALEARVADLMGGL